MTSIFGLGCLDENARLVAALDLADVGCWELSMIDHRFWISDRLKSHFRYAGNNIISYEKMMNFIHLDDRERARQSFDETLNAGYEERFDIDVRSQTQEINTCWLNWKGRQPLITVGWQFTFRERFRMLPARFRTSI